MLSSYLLQKKILRIVTGSSYFAQTEPIFKSLDIIKLEDNYKLKVLKFYFNFNKFDVFYLNQSNEPARKSFHYDLINIINNTPSIVNIHTQFKVLLTI